MFSRMMNYGLEGMERPAPSSAANTLTRELVRRHLPKYKRHGDLIIVQETAWEQFKLQMPLPVVEEADAENSPLSVDEDELASLVCQAIQKPECKRLAIDKGIRNDNYRTPNMKLILGDSALVSHKDNRILYQFDVTKCMFSFGNINEKARMAQLDCSNQVVVDLFAGIGYFTLPLLVHANASHVYACEWNPYAVEALSKNLSANKIDPTRCTILEGDNRTNRPTGVAQRVILGILPSSAQWLHTALECVDRKTGAILHCHDLVQTKPPAPLHNQQNNNNIQETSGPSTDPSFPSCDTSTSIPTTKTTEDSPIATTSTLHTSPCEEQEPPLNHMTTSTQQEACHRDNGSTVLNHLTQHDLLQYQARARHLIDSMADELRANNFRASLENIQPIKSYAPHINHVVFDIKIEPL